ncbi:hypothetical protein [Gordonia soli]|uniref:DUF4878 domain-containing protein n=1 Tax=Gordonia soli NBRC 108243 TaxID=1223545 RepID=M0QMP2_9ACTN|nr:hypothetical protein [Gordonia soli]GAC69561.1 hypothetical protein GS4_26_00080 [Gordonia soli NBRC 108243]
MSNLPTAARWLLPCAAMVTLTATGCGADPAGSTPSDRRASLDKVRAVFDETASAVNARDQQAFSRLLCADVRESDGYKTAPSFAGFPPGPVVSVEEPTLNDADGAEVYATINYEYSPLRTKFSFAWENDEWKFCPQTLLVVD